MNKFTSLGDRLHRFMASQLAFNFNGQDKQEKRQVIAFVYQS